MVKARKKKAKAISFSGENQIGIITVFPKSVSRAQSKVYAASDKAEEAFFKGRKAYTKAKEKEALRATEYADALVSASILSPLYTEHWPFYEGGDYETTIGEAMVKHYNMLEDARKGQQGLINRINKKDKLKKENALLAVPGMDLNLARQISSNLYPNLP